MTELIKSWSEGSALQLNYLEETVNSVRESHIDWNSRELYSRFYEDEKEYSSAKDAQAFCKSTEFGKELCGMLAR